MSDICEHGVNFYKRRCYKCRPREPKAQISLAQAPAVLLRRDPIEAVASCRREGWVGAMSFVYGVFTIRDGAAVRVIMRDGRSGNVKWDTAPTNQAETDKAPDRESEIESLLREVMRLHADSNSPEYNECDNATCNWCVRASRVIGQNTKL